MKEPNIDRTYPMNWELPKLGDVASINPKLPDRNNIAHDLEVQFVPMRLVEELNGKVYLTETGTYANLKKGYTPFINNDVIFAKVTPCMENGKVAVVDNLKNGIGFGSSEFHVIRSGEKLQNKYAFYYLIQGRFRSEAESAMTGAVGLRRVPKQFLENYPIPLPPLPEQQAIVSKIEELFSELDKGVEELKAAQQQLKVYRQAVLKWAFEGKLTNDDVKEGELPEGWKWMKISEIAESLDHKRKPINKAERENRKGNIPYYGANGQTGWIDDFLFDEPLILVVEDETFIGRESPFSYKVTGKSWVNNHAHILKTKYGNSIDFLNYQLYYYPFLPIVTGTTGRKKLTKNALINASVKTCSYEEQKEVIQQIESRLSVCEKIEETITNGLRQSEALRQSILKQAFEGKLV